MQTKVKTENEAKGAGKGAAMIERAQLSPIERKIYDDLVRRRRNNKEGGAIAAGRAREVEYMKERRAGTNEAKKWKGRKVDLGALVERAKSKLLVSRSVRDAIAAHDACLVPAAGSRRAGRGGWKGVDRVEVAIWRGAAFFADSIARHKKTRAYLCGPDGRAGLREIVFHEVPFLLDAAGRLDVAGFRVLVRQVRARIKADCKPYFSALRDERRRKARRESFPGEAWEDSWEDRDEWSGAACSPWPEIVEIAKVEIPLPGNAILQGAKFAAVDEFTGGRVLSSDPRKLRVGEPGKRKAIVDAGAGAVAAGMFEAARLFAQRKGKGAGSRLKGARALVATVEAVRVCLDGGTLSPQDAAGLSSGPQGGIGKAWERRIEKLRPILRSAGILIK